jgi:AsmA protein
MSKPLKIFLGVAGGLVILLIAALVAAAMLFDANNFRGKMAAEVNDRYHRQLEVGNIKLSVFPWLRIKVSAVKLGNAEGFGKEPFAEVGELDVGVGLLPLIFAQRVQARTISLSGLRLNLEKNAKGENNWSDLAEGDKSKQDEPKDNQGFALKDIDISGIELKDAALNYSDAQAGKHYSVEHLDLKTGKLKQGKPFDVEIALALASKAPDAQVALKIKGTMLADADSKTYSISDLKLGADLAGGAVPSGKQSITLSGNAEYNQASGSGSFNKGELQAAGITVNIDISGSGLAGDAPKLSGPIKIKTFNPREVLEKLGVKSLDTADKSALKEASLSAQYNGDFKSAALSGLSLSLDQTNIAGNLTLRDFSTQAIDFSLKADKLDADRYLAPKSDKMADGPSAAKKAELNGIKIPSDMLNALNLNGTLDVGTLKLSGVTMSNVRLKLSGAKDSPKQQEISANLYGGQIKANTRVNGRSYAVNTQLQGLNTGPFLKDFVGKDSVSGLGNLSLDVTGAGATVGDVRRTLNGAVSFNLQNGSVKGFNLGQVIRNGQALLSGQQTTAKDNAVQQTDFATFSAAGKIVNGILKSDTLDAKSPLLRLSGAGEIDLINETINYVAKPTIVETSQGQGGKELDALRGLTVPIQLSGNLYAPQYQVMVNDVLKQQATAQLQKQLEQHHDEIQQKLKEKLGDDLGSALSNLLGGRSAPAQPSQPAQQQKPGT